MRKSILLICSLLVFLSGFGQLQPYNKAFIWRGFKHAWTYNHRCNRLGDYVGFNSGTPISVHCSATGIGADSAYYTSFYTFVSTPCAVFKEGETEVKIQAKEKQLVERTVTVSVPADDWMKEKADYVTLLNGFDLRSDDAADKMQLMRVSIEDGEYDPMNNAIRFAIKVSLVLNCQSIECSETNQRVNYDLSVHYLIVGLNEDSAQSTQQYFTRSYSWDKKEALNELPESKFMFGDITPVFPEATVGIKSFSFVLNEAHWLVEMNSNVTPLSYDPQDANMKLAVDMLFREWQEGMRRSEVSPGQAKFSEKRKGWVVMDMDVVMLQFKKANIVYGKNSGRTYWRGNIGSSNGDKAKTIFDIPYD